MDDTMTSLVDKIISTNPGALLAATFLFVALIYTNRSHIVDFFDTYITGKHVITKAEHEKNTATGELVKVLNDMQDNQSKLLESQQDLQDNIQQLQRQVDENNKTINNKIEYITETCDFLTVCDKEDKKAYITKEYNYFYIRLKKIDIYSKATVERIYELYLKENGDTYVAEMMSQLRSLPVVPQITDIDRQGPTALEAVSGDPLTHSQKKIFADSHT